MTVWLACGEDEHAIRRRLERERPFAITPEDRAGIRERVQQHRPFAVRLAQALELRERLRREQLERPWLAERHEKARAAARDLLSEALEIGLEARVGSYLREPLALEIATALVQAGGEPPEQHGVCETCGLVWRRPVRKNLARRCEDCCRRGTTPAVEWPRPLLRRLGLKVFVTQPCAVCGMPVEVAGLRDVAYCRADSNPYCKQRGDRRRRHGLPMRDARAPEWIDMSWLLAETTPAGVRTAHCQAPDCHAEYATIENVDGLCPLCEDLAAGHQTYRPYEDRSQEGWCGTSLPA